MIALLFLNVTIDNIVLITPSISWIEMPNKLSRSRPDKMRFFESPTFIFLITGILIIIMIIFSYIRYLNFYSENWDLGINMQQLWTNTHGYLLYDSGDYESYGVLSHLEVHSSFIAYPLSYLYFLFPYSLTIFSIQSFAVFSSVPVLYFLTVEITKDRKIATFASIIYGFNASLITAVLYDYHWLSFMPLYSFLFLYLILKRKFLLSSLIIIIGNLTEEAFTFISISLILFVFMSDINLSFSKILTKLKAEWKFLALGILSILVYTIITLIEHNVIPVYLHNQSAIPILIRKTGQPLLPSSSALFDLPGTLGYWAFSISMLCFIPLFYRKTGYIVLIWLVETIIFVPHYATLGSQYSFITMSLLAPTLPFGLLSIKKGLQNSIGLNKRLALPLIPVGLIIAISANDFNIVFLSTEAIIFSVLSAMTISIFIYLFAIKKKRINLIKFVKKHSRLSYSLILVAIVSMNIMVSPLNPQNDHHVLILGGGYKFKYSINPESKYMKYIQEDIGYNSTIITSNNLFPYIANDRNAYSSANASYSHSTIFPFNKTNLPEFILLSSSQKQYAFTWVLNDLNNPLYRIRCEIIYSGYPGNITLWELNYTGNGIYYDA